MTSPKALGTKRVVRVFRRSPIAKARDAFMAIEGARLSDASTLGTSAPSYYLRNRIEKAFIAGVQFGLTQPKPKRTGRNGGRGK